MNLDEARRILHRADPDGEPTAEELEALDIAREQLFLDRPERPAHRRAALDAELVPQRRQRASRA